MFHTDDTTFGYLGIGEFYYVHPESSMTFGGRQGRIVSINKTNQMPYSLVFEGDIVPYQFAREELLSEKEYRSIFGGY